MPIATTGDKSVFVNCPFDGEYAPIFHAITFMIRDAGYVPRSALEGNDSDTERLSKIVRIIGECRLAIHDISRVESTELPTASVPIPRFNMPFECGLFYGAKTLGANKHRKKKMLVLDSEPHRYMISLSDLAGKDAECHHNDPRQAIACVRRFLGAQDSNHLGGDSYYIDRYEQFLKALPKVASGRRFTVDEVMRLECWPAFVHTVDVWKELG